MHAKGRRLDKGEKQTSPRPGRPSERLGNLVLF